jgi:pimeloyl-ACP methyl ester carboxylesterase
LLRTLALALGLSLLSSCGLLRLKRSVQQLNAHGVVTLKVLNPSATATNYALAIAQTPSGSDEMTGFQVLGADGYAVFLLRQERSYAVGAFSDLNGNGTYDGEEPAQLLRQVRPMPMADVGKRAEPLPLTLTTNNDLPRGQNITLPRQNDELGGALSVSLGKIADLDQPQFSSAVGEMGMWQPYEFIQQHGLGIYFLEPYAPKKTPVVFVYGISGSPQDWRSLLEKLDRKKYQPWVFHYPSGLRLDKSANALASGLLLLKERHQFQRLDVVAHSMGGLVSRGAIQRLAALGGTNFIAHFVTIATPWEGHQAAALGVKHLDFPVPAWRDMTPGSDYLKDILASPLPRGTRHDLIFGYKSSGGLGLPEENDGVVGVASELALPMQEEAASILGLHEDHTGILTSKNRWDADPNLSKSWTSSRTCWLEFWPRCFCSPACCWPWRRAGGSDDGGWPVILRVLAADWVRSRARCLACWACCWPSPSAGRRRVSTSAATWSSPRPTP